MEVEEELLTSSELKYRNSQAQQPSSFRMTIFRSVVIGLISLMLIFLLVLIILAASIKRDLAKIDSSTTETPNTPTTGSFPDEWNKLAKDVVSMMDFSANPCSDFYQYSCGNWISNFKLPLGVSMYSPIFDQTEQGNGEHLYSIAKSRWPLSSDFFSSCNGDPDVIATNFDQLVYQIAQQIYQINIQNNDINANNKFWEVLAALHRSGVDAFFLPDVLENIYEISTFNYLLLMEGGTSAPAAIYDDATFKDSYINVITASLVFSSATSFTQNDLNQVVAISQQIYNLERSLAYVQDEFDFSKFDEIVKYFTYSEFKQQSSLSLDTYFTTLKLSNNTSTLGVFGPNFFKSNALFGILNQVNNSTMHYYLIWRVVLYYLNLGITPFPIPQVNGDYLKNPKAVLSNIPPEQRKTSIDKFKTPSPFSKFHTKVGNKRDEWTDQEYSCLVLMNTFLGDFIGHLFSEDILNPELENDIRTMTSGIKNAFRGGLDELSWIDSTSKQATIYKLENIIQIIGHPNALATYRGVILEPEAQSFPFNIQFLSNFLFDRRMTEIGTPYKRENYQFDPTVVNAFYMPLTNTINFPAGILESPMYSISLPRLFRYARLGYVVGHEITHGFDNHGSQWGAFGTFKEFMDEASLRAFSEHSSCIAKQYSGYEVVPGYFINGDQTLGENIADLGGIKNAWRSYQAWKNSNGDEFKNNRLVENISNEQLFWVILGQTWCTKATDAALIRQLQLDEHSPGKFRVNGPLSNFDKFAEAFSCPQGSPMNPNTKCTLW